MTTNCYFDGACDPNPGGEMGWGWLIRDVSKNSGHVAKSRDNSCNVAEYMALYFLLEEIDRLFQIKAITGPVVIHGDSKLVINQMSGAWRIKNGKYKPWGQKSQALLKRIRKTHGAKIQFEWIRRDKNSEADALSKAYIDNEIDASHFSSDWIKAVVKSMVEREQITLEELVDYVMEV